MDILTAGFALGAKTLVQPLSLRLEPGRVTAILGPNGAGKSTLLGLLAGHRPGQSGDVILNGRSIRTQTAQELALQRALLPQDTSTAFDFSVREIAELGRFPHRRKPAADEDALVEAAMEATGVRSLRHRILNTLSGGEKSRAQLARVLCQIWEPLDSGLPRWLLLDEPTAALDLAHQHHVLGMVRRWAKSQGVGVVAVLHDVNLALRYADDVLLLQAGRAMGWGETSGVLTPEAVGQVWGVACETANAADGVPQFLMAPASLHRISKSAAPA